MRENATKNRRRTQTINAQEVKLGKWTQLGRANEAKVNRKYAIQRAARVNRRTRELDSETAGTRKGRVK